MKWIKGGEEAVQRQMSKMKINEIYRLKSMTCDVLDISLYIVKYLFKTKLSESKANIQRDAQTSHIEKAVN